MWEAGGCLRKLGVVALHTDPTLYQVPEVVPPPQPYLGTPCTTVLVVESLKFCCPLKWGTQYSYRLVDGRHSVKHCLSDAK
jgi:hypothetical protein